MADRVVAAGASVSTWFPTRKWVAAFITYWVVFALTKLAIPIDPIVEQAINGVAALIAAYVVKNDPTPGGLQPVVKR
jgi:hypothetical protein